MWKAAADDDDDDDVFNDRVLPTLILFNIYKKSNFICWPVREFVRYYLWYLYCDGSLMV
jgi:hypothetical protein